MRSFRSTTLVLLLAFTCSCFLVTCRSDKGVPDFNGYPDKIGKLIYAKCATAGCHTDADKEAAGGLSLESWESMFKGGHGGAAVIPYRTDYSTLFSYTNTFPELGSTLTPTMPYGGAPLTRAEVMMLKEWIDAGAPSRENFIKFSDNPNRRKYYVANQGCDVVTVFDQASGLPMRYIDVGQYPGIESPHMIRVSPDKQYWYVISLTGLYLEKYRCSDDSYAGRAYIGPGYWNAFTISDNSAYAYCTDLGSDHAKMSTVTLSTLSVDSIRPFFYPHGIALTPGDNDTLYITQQFFSSKLHKVPIIDPSASSEIELFTGAPPALPLGPHEIVFSPDGTKYFVTCQSSNDVRVFTAHTDQLITIIPVGASPTEMAFSPSTHRLFVSCTEDTTTFSGKRGSVAIIDYNSYSVDYLYTGHQPHGIAVDEAKRQVIVINRNNSTDGPAPHHTSACGGRNGYVTFIDLNTMDMVKGYNGVTVKKIEISVDPYSVSVR